MYLIPYKTISALKFLKIPELWSVSENTNFSLIGRLLIATRN